jgi:RNA polymerase sigma factor (sigma-70 family)
MSDLESFATEFGSQAEIDALAARGGHDEATVLTLFRRLRGGASHVRGGDTSSMRDHLVMVHAPLVEHCARSFLASGEPLDDLVQEGYVGLIKAVDRFDPDKGIKFSTYACHLISGEIRHYLRDLGRLIHEPGWHFELRQRIARAGDSLTQQTGRVPTPEEIAAHLSVKVETVRDVLSRAQTLNVESLDAKDAQDESEGRLSVLERHEVDRAGYGRGEASRVEDQLFIEAALPQLKELEQQAVRLFFFEELTKTEIARHLGISVNYVSYLVKRGTEALRRILEATEPLPAVHSTAATLSQQQARAAFLLQLAKSSAEGDTRRAFKPHERVPAVAKPGVSAFPQFAAWLDDEVARVGRYGGEFSVLWFQIRNWAAITKNLSVSDKRAATAATAALVRRLCRNVDKVAAMQSADPPGLHFFVLMPVTGSTGEVVGKRLTQAFLKPDLPAITAPLHTRMAFAICPENGRIGDELFVYLGQKLAVSE